MKRYHWCASVLNKWFFTPFRDGIWNHRQVSVGDRRSFPHDPETVGDREPWCIQLSLYNRFWYLEYPKHFILATRLCSHCHHSRSFVVLPKTRKIPGTGVFQADSRHGSFFMPGTSQTVHDYKPCTIGRQSHTFSFPAPYVIVSHINTLCK